MTNSRKEIFYTRAAVPDTFDGRFDLLLLHIFIILHILMAGTDRRSKAVSQAIFDRMFADMEQSLREIGIGDASIPRQVKRMMKAFNGRMHAYQEAIAQEQQGINATKKTLMRNLYGTVTESPDQENMEIMNNFLQANIRDKSAHRVKKIMQGHIKFDNSPLLKKEQKQSTTTKSTETTRLK
ncbi:MAG: ubiquinol-cytochrome C chaperone family protein [Alphaproteobacteria bacterium]